MAKHSKAEQAEALADLRKILRRGDVVTAVCKEQYRSGTTVWDFYKFKAKGERLYLNHKIAVILGERQRSGGEIILPFMNMDPVFQTVYNLAHKLFKARTIKCDRCKGTGNCKRLEFNPECVRDNGASEYREVTAPCDNCGGIGKRKEDVGYLIRSERI